MDFIVPLPSSAAPPIDVVEVRRSLRRYFAAPDKGLKASNGGFNWKRFVGISAPCVAAGLFLLWYCNKETRDGKPKSVEQAKDKQCYDLARRPIPCDKGIVKDWRG